MKWEVTLNVSYKPPCQVFLSEETAESFQVSNMRVNCVQQKQDCFKGVLNVMVFIQQQVYFIK